MTTPNDASHAHPTTMLLPWYLTGTLKASERQAVDEHLAGCADCRAELESLTRLRIPLKAALAEEPMPALRLQQDVMARIHAERASAPPPHAVAPGGGFGDALEQWFRNLFTPRWIPALAATLLIGQLALLLWTAGEQTALPPGRIVARGIQPAATRVVLVFQESTSETRIRATILALNGRLVDGPTADGRYTIELPSTEPRSLDQQLQTLRQQSNVIRRAERLAP